jgi:hypothetical protein
MKIMEQLGNFMGVLNEVLGIPIVVSHTISEGVSEGINDGINRNRKWIVRGAMRLTLFLVGLFFLFLGISQIGDNAFPQYKGVTAVVLGLFAGIAIILIGSNEA